MSVFSPNRLDELLCRLVDGMLSDGEAAELEVILLESPDARERYRVFSATHLMLAAGQHEAIPVSHAPAPRRVTALALAAAAVAVLAAGLVIWQASRAGQGRAPVAAEETRKPVLAVVARADQASWNLPMPADGGTTLHSTPVHLTRGTLVLELAGGQTLTMSAPTSFELIDEREMVLLKGDASLRIKDKRSPYVIQVPGGAVVDLGTEFSVKVTPDGVSDVHVFEGMANASLVGSGGRTREERLLKAGQSVRISNVLEDSPTEVGDFIRQLPSDDLHTSPAGDAYAAAVARSTPLAWWRFDRLEDGRTVLPEAGNLPLVLHGHPAITGGTGHRFMMTDNRSSAGFAMPPEPIQGLDTPKGFSVELLIHPTTEAYATVMAIDEPGFAGKRKPEFPNVKHPPQRAAIERMGPRGSKIGHVHADYALRAMMRSPAGYDGEINTYSTESYLIYRWVHVVFTHDGTALRTYIDGELSDEVGTTLRFQNAALRPIIGRMQPLPEGEQRQWVGGIDEVSLYNRALDPAEIRAHAAALGR